ncbi:uncharacterized protein DUF4892 [Marinobacter sp. LV10MA510-1]|nr:uncharacterized protein DUF4892 [Marinobacter sp. LV10MA510-1]PFG54777.1 uncharacterized protein DUF4892 [Marinobacter sp. LV10R520-4]
MLNDRCAKNFVIGAALILGAMLAVASQQALAAFPETAPEKFPASELEETRPLESGGHLVLFSPVREINSEIRSDVMARLPVSGNSLLYRINADASRVGALNHYRQELLNSGANILFECTGVRCGRSNVWANQIFDKSMLLGRDTAQDYLVVGTVSEDGQRWLTLVYTVTRGNQSEYVWVEHFEVGSGAVVPGLGSLQSRIRGPLIVAWQDGFIVRFDWKSKDRRMLRDWADADGSTVILITYSELEGSEPLEDAMARARTAGESMSDLLVQTGIVKERQQLVVVGPSIVQSDPLRKGNRVEILVISR